MASVRAVKRRGRFSPTDPANLPPDLFQQVLDEVFKSEENSRKESEHRSLGVHGTNFTAALVSKRWHRASMRALTVARVTAGFEKETDLLKELTRFKALAKVELCENAVDSLSEKFLRAAGKNWPGLRTLVLHDTYTSFHDPELVVASLLSLTSVVISDSRELFRSVYDPLTSWMFSVENLTNLELLNCCIMRMPGDFGSCFLKLRRFQLSHIRGLTMLPESMGDLVGLRELVLENCNELSALPRTFSRLSGLRKLKWASPNIRDLRVIATLKGLRSLHLDTSTLEDKAPAGLFAGLKLLRVLKLRTPRPSEIFPSSLEELHALLVPRNISFSPALQSLIHCTGLRVLKLHGCEVLLEDLGWLSELTALRIFEVVSDRVPDLPANVGALKHVERVCLETGRFKTLPRSFGDMTSLRYLRIESSFLQELPDSLASLTQLTHLSLSGSVNFNEASMNLGSITSLQTLSISGCSLIGIPEDLGCLPNLTMLCIDCRPLDSLLPRGFPELQELHISGCLLSGAPALMAKSEVAQLSVEDYPCLRVLKIDSWEAESLPNALGQLQHLEHLELSDGDFTQLPEALSSLGSLKSLYLEECKQLVSVPAALGAVSSLISLRVDKCDSFNFESLTGRLKEVHVT